MTPALSELTELGVAVWLDDLSRDLLSTGALARLVSERHVVGVTTNPAIIHKALSAGSAYDEQIRDCALRGTDVGETLRTIVCTDVRAACDMLRPVHQATGGLDGRVSIEVDPRIAEDPHATLAEARALWWMVDRPNLFIKIPAVQGGLPAVPAALADGISVNVTLIFSLERYTAVQDAYLDGLERRLAAGHDDLQQIHSVASFFVSRVDTEIDQRLTVLADRAEQDGNLTLASRTRSLRGRAAIANARLAYAAHQQLLSSPRWQALAARGARPQRPLWASTGVKNADHDDTRYVIDLAAPGTVNTMPDPTLQAVADHGAYRGNTLSGRQTQARAVLAEIADVGIDYDDVVAVLEQQGVQSFAKAWNTLIDGTVDQLQTAGATVRPDGSTRPAGAGPAAAAPA